MANVIRKDGGEGLRRRELDPFQMMREFLRGDPFRDLEPVWTGDEPVAFEPDFEVKETDDAYVFLADLPGVEDENLELTLEDNRLTIAGKREEQREQKDATYYACERSYGAFSRSFTLPEGVDVEHLESRLQKGVLTLVVPKKAELRPRRIPVETEVKAKA